MDAFYASVEQRDRPELRGLPVIVGADPGGAVSSRRARTRRASSACRSAMPISRAYRLCPHGVYLPVDMDKYARVSGEIMAILGDFSPLVEPVSVDEAFIDLTGTETLWGRPARRCARIKARIRARRAHGLAGLAANKFVAKVASDLRKPDGLVVVPAGGEAAFLAPLPIERLWGVGKATAKELETLGVATIGQLQRSAPARLTARLGPHGPDLLDLRDSAATSGRSSRSRRRSRWARRRRSAATARARRPGGDAARSRPSGSRASCAPRAGGVPRDAQAALGDFRTLTRSHTGDPTQDGLEIYRRATTLLARERARAGGAPHRCVRLDVSSAGARTAPVAGPGRGAP
jgi:DNA polymerase-4